MHVQPQQSARDFPLVHSILALLAPTVPQLRSPEKCYLAEEFSHVLAMSVVCEGRGLCYHACWPFVILVMEHGLIFHMILPCLCVEGYPQPSSDPSVLWSAHPTILLVLVVMYNEECQFRASAHATCSFACL